MLVELSSIKKVVGQKQSVKAISDGTALKVYIAKDADKGVTDPIERSCREKGVKVFFADSMLELGLSAGIKVGAAVVTAVK